MIIAQVASWLIHPEKATWRLSSFHSYLEMLTLQLVTNGLSIQLAWHWLQSEEEDSQSHITPQSWEPPNLFLKRNEIAQSKQGVFIRKTSKAPACLGSGMPVLILCSLCRARETSAAMLEDLLCPIQDSNWSASPPVACTWAHRTLPLPPTSKRLCQVFNQLDWKHISQKNHDVHFFICVCQ